MQPWVSTRSVFEVVIAEVNDLLDFKIKLLVEWVDDLIDEMLVEFGVNLIAADDPLVVFYKIAVGQVLGFACWREMQKRFGQHFSGLGQKFVLA